MNQFRQILESLQSIEADDSLETCGCNQVTCAVCFPEEVEITVEDVGAFEPEESVGSMFDVDDSELDDFPDAEQGGQDQDEVILKITELMDSNPSQTVINDAGVLQHMSPKMLSVVLSKLQAAPAGQFGEVVVTEYDVDGDNLGLKPASFKGASRDVSDLIAQIMYIQDLGVSNSPATYSEEKLLTLPSEAVERIYQKVVGDDTLGESAGIGVDRNRDDGMIVVHKGHQKVKISLTNSGYNVLKMAGGHIGHAATEDEAIDLAAEYLNSNNLVEGKIQFGDEQSKLDAISLLGIYGYEASDDGLLTIEVDAPSVVLDSVADKFNGSVQYQYA